MRKERKIARTQKRLHPYFLPSNKPAHFRLVKDRGRLSARPERKKKGVWTGREGEAREEKNVQCPSEARKECKSSYIICIFHEIINIILFYIDRCFNSFSCAMRKDHPAAYERLQGKGEHARDPFQIARTSLLPLFYTVPLYLISWNYFHHRDRWLSIRFCTW